LRPRRSFPPRGAGADLLAFPENWRKEKAAPKGGHDFSLDDPPQMMAQPELKVIGDRFVTGALTVTFGLVGGNLQFRSPFLAFLFGKFALAPLEGGQFLLRRLKKAVARCYSQLSVSRHCAPRRSPRPSILAK